MSSAELGRWGETIAIQALEIHKYTIVERNWRCPVGEIDVVARDGEMWVFVEVKTRSSTNFGFPEQAVDDRKQDRLLAAAQAYLQAHPELGGDWRVDVIAIQRSRRGDEPEIIHFENALS